MEEGKSHVRAVDRALDILLCFTTGTNLAMTEIADKVGLHKSTVHRMLATLEDKGFVERDPISDRYHLGIRVWELSAHLSGTDEPAIIWQPEMERLRDQLGETVSIYVRDGQERIRIQAVQSNQPVRRVAPVGARLPLYAGASSKVLIAYADRIVRERIIGDPSWPAIIDLEQYQEQLEEILAQGYATSFEEREPGVAALSAPIFNRNGDLSAALSLSGPSSRLTIEMMREYAPLLMESAKRMGTMLR
ncbi:IclR family transcriptional regulator [Paenibacillus radicis (ex Gao et al. 2016)]|jgi:IclR family transcriptional regulator, KDG regulon repressor|uniref:Glycerol operon regulatory protein n=1 Tax=Paenibacillus radicis (ex Gao et al. 2016) TaxID=1737354 RepID=A0A917M6H2_9BACL|nr:IclR family transcriptional regulator [Paenibacillus radicis (ex Gao et al. 2016)]GGG78069.1 IclR family transcriptional regulator [Paenibacillus radicis (ex Gao et al. 2016)]